MLPDNRIKYVGKVLISHPFGNQNVRNAALALAETELLAELWVGAVWNNDMWINKLIPSGLLRQLNRRSFPDLLKGNIRDTFWYEAIRMLAPKLGLTWLTKNERFFSEVGALQHMDNVVAARLRKLNSAKMIYAYEGSAMESFKVAREKNIRRVLELPTPPWRMRNRILQEELTLYPELQRRDQFFSLSKETLKHKDIELALADKIIVPCNFVRDCLLSEGESSEKIMVIPYGCPSVSSVSKFFSPARKLRALFVGSLSIGKGIPYLLDAIKMLNGAVSLTVIGNSSDDSSWLARAVMDHVWVKSVPHQEILAQMREHDVLVFPSLFEGFGLVILEALSQGLPVITTTNTGGSHVIDEGENGFVIPIRSSEAIAEKLDLLSRDRKLLQEMSTNAKCSAEKNGWEKYRTNLVEMLGAL